MFKCVDTEKIDEMLLEPYGADKDKESVEQDLLNRTVAEEENIDNQ